MPEQTPDFNDKKLTLSEIKDAGWKRWDGNGGWYGFERVGPCRVRGERYSVPHWVREMVRDARREGEETARCKMRAAIGLTETHRE